MTFFPTRFTLWSQSSASTGAGLLLSIVVKVGASIWLISVSMSYLGSEPETSIFSNIWKEAFEINQHYYTFFNDFFLFHPYSDWKNIYISAIKFCSIFWFCKLFSMLLPSLTKMGLQKSCGNMSALCLTNWLEPLFFCQVATKISAACFLWLDSIHPSNSSLYSLDMTII